MKKALNRIVQLIDQNKKITFIAVILLLLYMVSSSLNPFDGQMFEFHDETQSARITDFVINLKHFQIPPRIGPEYSFNLGFPVFNFYAPTAYWITSIFALLGVSEMVAVKLSFLLAVLVAFIGMLYLLTRFFDYYAGLLGSVVYVTSTYMATEIVIRGNLAEMWFLALFPFGLGLLVQNSKSKSVLCHIALTIVLSLLFTTHNMLGLVSFPIAIIAALLLPDKKRNFLAIANALLIDSYFFIPAFLESSFVQAQTLAKLFDYSEHFLCSWQLWSAHGWQFGGSLKGCDADMMSFKLGKLHLILGALGVIFLLFNLIRHQSKPKQFMSTYGMHLFFAFMTVGSLFLTLYASQFIWDALKPVMSLFQFPWRFLVFGMFGVGFFSAYLFAQSKNALRIPIIFGIMFVLFITGYKYFVKPQMPHDLYYGRYVGKDYRAEIFAYNVKEYLPRGVDYDHWHYLNPTEANRQELGFDRNKPVQFDGPYDIKENSYFNKRIVAQADGMMYVNVHYLPYWQISINSKEIIPQSFDNLARPYIKVQKDDLIRVKYSQTPMEKTANLMSLIGIASLLFLYKKRKAGI